MDVESAVLANFEFLSSMRSTNDSGDVDMDEDVVDDDDDDEDDDEMGMADDVIDMTSNKLSIVCMMRRLFWAINKY